MSLSSLDELPPIPEPDETGATFCENARLKARYYASVTGLLTVAEDSGLAIDALAGEPGVRSARYLHPSATYETRFADIQRRLEAVPTEARTAQFVCALAVAAGTRILFEATGTIRGVIVPDARGSRGFGYDPIFCYPPYGRTLAEVSASEKLRVSHRGEAFRLLGRWLTSPDALNALQSNRTLM